MTWGGSRPQGDMFNGTFSGVDDGTRPLLKELLGACSPHSESLAENSTKSNAAPALPTSPSTNASARALHGYNRAKRDLMNFCRISAQGVHGPKM